LKFSYFCLLQSAEKAEKKSKSEKEECKLELDEKRELVGSISTKLKVHLIQSNVFLWR